jgi:hypothetical protein
MLGVAAHRGAEYPTPGAATPYSRRNRSAARTSQDARTSRQLPITGIAGGGTPKLTAQAHWGCECCTARAG